jgi:hypothetical protein
MLTGCAEMMARALVPDVQTRMSDDELSHLKAVNGDLNKTIVSLAGTTDLDRREKLVLAKILLKGSKEATDIKPSATENMAQQYARMVGREGVEDGISAGIGWSKGLISTVGGGGVAGMGGLGILFNILRKKNKVIKVVNSELTPEEKAKVKKALEHTGTEHEVA